MTPRGGVVVCGWRGRDGGLPAGSEEMLALGRKAAGLRGAPLHWLLLGALEAEPEEVAARFGVEEILRLEHARLAEPTPDLLVDALAGWASQESPGLLIFGQDAETRLIAARLAGRLGAGALMNVVDVARGEEGALEATASAYGGDTRMVYELADAPCHVLALAAHSLALEGAEGASAPPRCRTIALAPGGPPERIRVIEPARAEGPRLEDAQVIVSGGRGLGSAENYRLVEELAEALGGLPGASRPLVDEGWVDSSRQVGLTGRITRPSLYVAAGISGASQHMAGCSAARTLVAINRDPDAAIFRYARYGLVGDCLEILPELIRAARSPASREPEP